MTYESSEKSLWKLGRLLSNVVRDLRFGGKFLGGVIENERPDVGAYASMNSPYEDCLEILTVAGVDSDAWIVDIGCGKGRVINSLLYRGHTGKITGIELDESVAKATKKRLRRFLNVEIISGNVLDINPPKADFYYLFNPFSDEVLTSFLRRLIEHGCHGRLIYYNAVWRDTVESCGYRVVTEGVLRHPFIIAEPAPILQTLARS